MKIITFAIISVFLCLFFLTGCPHKPGYADIIVENASGFDVENIKLVYHHETKGEQVEHINLLKPGDSRTITVITQHGIGGVFVTTVEIEYSINGIIHNFRHQEYFTEEDWGYDYVIAQLSSGRRTKFIIKNDFYRVINDR